MQIGDRLIEVDASKTKLNPFDGALYTEHSGTTYMTISYIRTKIEGWRPLYAPQRYLTNQLISIWQPALTGLYYSKLSHAVGLDSVTSNQDFRFNPSSFIDASACIQKLFVLYI